MERHALNPDSVGLVVVNERDFYAQYAKPLCERHALLYTATNIEDLRPTMESDWDLLAEYAADFYRFRVAEQLGEPWAPETPELLAGLRRYLKAHYNPAEYDPQSRVYGGDLINPVPMWEWGACIMKPGDLGVIGGATNRLTEGSVTFGCYSAFRGKNSKSNTGPEYVSCSGGPATIWTETDGATFDNRGAVRTYWRWPEGPRAHTALHYSMAVPVWNCDLNK